MDRNGRSEAKRRHGHGTAGGPISIVHADRVTDRAAIRNPTAESHLRADVLIEIEAECAAAEVGLAHDSVLAEHRSRRQQTGATIRAAHTDLVVAHRRRSKDRVLPIRGRHRCEGIERDALVVIRIAHVEQGKLIGRQQVDVLRRLLRSRVAVVRDAHLPRLSALRRHEDHAVCGTGAVDRRGRRVLQNVDGRDIARADLIQVGADDAVDDDERRVISTQRIATANANPQLRSGLGVGGLHLDAGNET